MPNTAEGFYYPDASTNIAPLETVLANMAASSDAVSKQTPRVFANYAAMIAAIPAPTAGRLAVTTQGSGILWQYDGTAAKWVVQNTPTFTDTAARGAAIPNPTAGIVAVIGTGAGYAEYVWDGTAWRSGIGGSLYNPSDVAVAAGLQAAAIPVTSELSGMTIATSRLTVTVPGVYSVSACATFYSTTINAADSAGIYRNGSGLPGGDLRLAAAGGDAMYKTGQASRLVRLAAGDYIELVRSGAGSGLLTQKSGSLIAVKVA